MCEKSHRFRHACYVLVYAGRGITAPVAAGTPPIDRRALVSRHDVVLTKPDPLTPLTVGNGDFAFTVDITGLQTFDDFHEAGMPLGTQSNWGWHSFPNPNGYTLDDCTVTFKDARGRDVPYRGMLADGFGGKDRVPERAREAMKFLRENPHRIDLGRIGLVLQRADGTRGTLDDLTNVRQTLNLWTGLIESQFTFEGHPVHVATVCHPTRDALGVKIDSPLLRADQLGVSIRFAGPCSEFRKGYDWQDASAHTTTELNSKSGLLIERKLDDTNYLVHLDWPQRRTMVMRLSPHEFVLGWPDAEQATFTCSMTPPDSGLRFGSGAAERVNEADLTFDSIREAAEQHWSAFWSTGGAIDLSHSSDPRAHELERRIVLSQYQTAVNCSGSVPPQETGLVVNSWFGKMHLEMHWWHAAHFALWGRPQLLERSLPWYRKVSGHARAFAKQQGYAGVRWQKMLGPFGPETPSDIGVFLAWQQPHFIAYCELLRRAGVTTIARDYSDLLFETAEFMASFAHREGASSEYSLGPPLIPAQECDGKFFRTIKNPTYELAYWHWGLKTANTWRERAALPRSKAWDDVADHLAKPPVQDGVYQSHASEPFLTYRDHPSHLMALGWCPPCPLIDAATMKRTFDDVVAKWDWPSTWGWDYPVLAMTAARLGRPDAAIDALFMPVQKNTYLANGHNYQDARLPLYLPGNGGLLYAVAMMAAGWDGSTGHAPGFPSRGWDVRFENLLPAI